MKIMRTFIPILFFCLISLRPDVLFAQTSTPTGTATDTPTTTPTNTPTITNTPTSTPTSTPAPDTSTGFLSPSTCSSDLVVSGKVWSNPQNATGADASYANVPLGPQTGNTNSALLKCTGYGVDIPAGSVVTGIQVKVQRYASVESDFDDKNVRLIVDNAPYGSDKQTDTAWPTSTGTATYGSSVDKWGVVAISEAEVEASTFGAGIAVQYAGSLTNKNAYVGYVQVNVHYVSGPTPTPTDTAVIPNTPTITPTMTATNTRTRTPTSTVTKTRTPTKTPIPTRTNVPSATPTFTPTITPTSTPTSTPTLTATFNTPTVTPTNTPANTPTITQTFTPTPTFTMRAALAVEATPCPTASTCTSRIMLDGAGHSSKLIAFDKTAGTGSFKLYCNPIQGREPKILIDTFTDDDYKVFTEYCEEIYIETSACNACTYSAFMR